MKAERTDKHLCQRFEKEKKGDRASFGMTHMGHTTRKGMY